jgi:hypothetical protein
MRENIKGLLYRDLFRSAALELFPLHIKLAIFNFRRQSIETAGSRPAKDSAVGTIYATVAGTFKMTACGIPVIMTAQMGADGGEHDYLRIAALDRP